MDLQTVLLAIFSAAIILTLIVGLMLKAHKSWVMTFFQNFSGAFFIFSGMVKAVDPLGTGFKLIDYFAEFQSTFEGTWFSFIAPLFPFLSTYSTAFSVFVIVLEIVLGVMLIIGHRPKLISALFLGIVVFFTFLTGFTYLTGYVPSGTNFFEFGKWAAYKETNMRVTDCGCFGDFLKLKPHVSFFKDVFLLIPAFYFMFRYKNMHQLFSSKLRWGITGLATAGLFLYCFSNFVWDLPHADFRPFKNGADIKVQKEVEMQAMENVDILGWQFVNEGTGEEATVMNPDYMAIIGDYPKAEGWKVKDQVKSDPILEPTKISEFSIEHLEGYEITDDILEDPDYAFMIVSYKLYGNGNSKTRTVQDTSFNIDTLAVEGGLQSLVKSVDQITNREEEYTDYVWKSSFAKDYTDVVKPFTDAAVADNIKVYGVVGGAGSEMISDLKNELQLNYPIHTADDILIKTIVRSNPGVLLWKDGKIIQKWHKDKLPSYIEVKTEFMN